MPKLKKFISPHLKNIFQNWIQKSKLYNRIILSQTSIKLETRDAYPWIFFYFCAFHHTLSKSFFGCKILKTQLQNPHFK